MCLGVCGPLQSIQWCSSVGCNVRVSPVASQCGAVSTKFIQWHSSVGLFQLSFSSGVPVYPASIRWVAQWYPSVLWVNQWHSSGIPVYTGPPSVHWLREREGIRVPPPPKPPGGACCLMILSQKRRWVLLVLVSYARIRNSHVIAFQKCSLNGWLAQCRVRNEDFY